MPINQCSTLKMFSEKQIKMGQVLRQNYKEKKTFKTKRRTWIIARDVIISMQGFYTKL